MMKRYFLALITTLLFSSLAYSQKITGTLKDATDNVPMAKATISLLKADSSTIVAQRVSANDGSFTISDVSSGTYYLQVTSIGFSPFVKKFQLGKSDYNFGSIEIHKSAETLSAVVIDATPPPVTMKGDTTQFSANQFKVNPDATTEDLIKKMPGITVDKSGTVTAQGETVKKVTVDGRDFFGDDATATLRNLPSEVVDKIQVFDRLSDQAQLTGFDDGNTTKSINIVTKPNMRQGNFGRIFAGYGTDNTYQGGGNISFFNNARRITLIGLTNNINQQNFSSEDLVNASGGRGGFRGGGGFGGGNNFFVGQQNGIAKTNSVGLNYSDAWGKKIDVTASYFFNNSSTNNNQLINRQNLLKDSVTYYDENTISHTDNYNHRFNYRMDYKLDSANRILVTANGGFQINNSINDILGVNSASDHQQLISKSGNDLTSHLKGHNISGGILYSHAFAKRGRSISLQLNANLTNNDGYNFNDALNSYFKTTLLTDTINQYTSSLSHSNRYSLNMVYTEPLATKTQLQFNYNPAIQKSRADRETFDFDNSVSKYNILDTMLSNKFDNTYNTQNAGITFRHGDRNNMISAGVGYQYSDLKSGQIFPMESNIRFTFSNFLGNVFGRFKVGKYGSIFTRYRGSVRAPSVTQLQNVINTSNQLIYSTGNPDLKQQYQNVGMIRYSYTNRISEKSFFANVFVNQINDYITNATFTASQDSVLAKDIILHRGSQLTKPVNLNGYISFRSFFNYSMPLKFIKTNLNLNGGISYSRQPGLLNHVSNISNNYNYNVGAVLASNISQNVDFNLSYNASFNNVNNTVLPNQNQNYVNQTAGLDMSLSLKKGTFFQNNISYNANSGLSAGFNQSFFLWNMAVGQRFLKGQRGEIKLSVFDLLKQNKSISRDVTESYIQDTRNQVLQQYFMLTFTYNLKNFGKAKPQNNDMEHRFFPGGGRPGGFGNRPSF